ncbi:hypothetical protein Ocin01_10668 [Orchesella cincta]|uniref:C-type lectin domain-containing protein n=1 Tax=Orchesella cincta TaxID=48709 RepID=A0A1D2MSV3_ORCCI|nr:hypothetical protein Ocin01_10668 [Orchesella cincta]
MRAAVGLFFCIFIVVDDPAVGAESNVDIQEVKKSSDIAILGTVEEKTYIGDTDDTLRNWTEAHLFCENRGLSLATIKTEGQAEFLKLAYDPLQFNGWYWVDAKDGGGENPKLLWTETSLPVREYDNLELKYWLHEEKAGNCLCYSSTNQENAYYFKHGCFHGHRTLCETYKPVKSFPNAKVLNRKNESPMIDLGTVGSKSYYGDHILRNWDDSRAHCESQGLKLAAVTLWSQSRFLKSASNKINLRWIPHNSLRLRSSCNWEYFTLCESWEKRPSSTSNLSGSSDITMPQSDVQNDLPELHTEVHLEEGDDDDDKHEQDMNDVEGDKPTSRDVFFKSILHLLHHQLLQYEEQTTRSESQEETTTFTP